MVMAAAFQVVGGGAPSSPQAAAHGCGASSIPLLGVGASHTGQIARPGGDASSSSGALPRGDGGPDSSATYPTRAVSPERGVGDRGGDSALLVLPARGSSFDGSIRTATSHRRTVVKKRYAAYPDLFGLISFRSVHMEAKRII